MRSRKPKRFRAGKEVKRRARAELGSPAPTRRLESRKHKPPKHKQRELLSARDDT